MQADWSSQSESGLTLVEFLVVVLIVSLLMTIAIPSMGDWIDQIRRKQVAQALWLGMMQAKSEAVKRNSRVVMCKSHDGMTCALNGGWEQGWLVFHDINNSGIRDGGEELISRHVDGDEGVIILSNGNIKRYVSFSQLGYSKLLSGAFQAGTFMVCPGSRRAPDAYRVVLNSLGRVKVETVASSNCVEAD